MVAGSISSCCYWNFSLILSFRPHYDPRVYEVCNKNEYHEYFVRDKGGRCVQLTDLLPVFAETLKSGRLKLLETQRFVQIVLYLLLN